PVGPCLKVGHFRSHRKLLSKLVNAHPGHLITPCRKLGVHIHGRLINWRERSCVTSMAFWWAGFSGNLSESQPSNRIEVHVTRPSLVVIGVTERLRFAQPPW